MRAFYISAILCYLGRRSSGYKIEREFSKKTGFLDSIVLLNFITTYLFGSRMTEL